MKKDWKIHSIENQVVDALARDTGLSLFLSKMLILRGLTAPRDCHAFLHPTLEALHSPFAFAEMESAVDRILLAVQKNENVLVYGDYDVDGLTATCLILEVLADFGLEGGYYIP
ncbi:single-stranded-DNA-specific exonuclease RecJ, partial [bacterium]|nr:single-stranded-DNA-specific exonuclease RecJ [bacterium]